MEPIERFLKACRREPVDRPPVWLMRQAGRYMASYQEVRKRVSFMELCRSPELVSEVSRMPLEQLGVDACIVFSDILVPLEALGRRFALEQGGPSIDPPVRSADELDEASIEAVPDRIGFVYDGIRRLRRDLDDATPLLGFVGSPWTLASYLVEGGSSRHHHTLKRWSYVDPDGLERLLERLSRVTAAHMRAQIEAGCDAIQLFDTWGGLLDADRWRRFSGRYSARALEHVADTGVPRIHYLLGGAHLLEEMAELPCEVLSVDWRVPLGEVRRRVGDRHALQGNLDPAALCTPGEVVVEETRRMLEEYGDQPGLVANLGHGVTPDASVDSARAFVDAVKRFGPEGTSP